MLFTDMHRKDVRRFIHNTTPAWESTCSPLTSKSAKVDIYISQESELNNSRVAQRKRAGPITQRSVDRNYGLLSFWGHAKWQFCKQDSVCITSHRFVRFQSSFACHYGAFTLPTNILARYFISSPTVTSLTKWDESLHEPRTFRTNSISLIPPSCNAPNFA
jgi:hypothetical protein